MFQFLPIHKYLNIICVIYFLYILFTYHSSSRYLVLASSAMMKASNDKDAAFVCFQSVGLEEDKYRLGNTKLFFRTGVVAYMEELREEKIQQMMKSVQVLFENKEYKKHYQILLQIGHTSSFLVKENSSLGTYKKEK